MFITKEEVIEMQTIVGERFAKWISTSLHLWEIKGKRKGNTNERQHQLTQGFRLTLVYSSTNMSKSVWTSGFWKPLVHKNMSNFWNNIFHKLGLHFPCICVLRTINVWTSELWCGRVTFLNHSSTIRVPKNP